MPAGYSVIVRGSHWPTTQALQDCLDRHDWPVRLGDSTHPQWSEPVETDRYTLGIPVVFKDAPIELEADIAILDYTNMPEIKGLLSRFGATHVPLEDGDRVLTLWVGSNIKEKQAAFYVMAALTKHFEGYGLGDGGDHGTTSYADSLLAEAKRLEAEGPRRISPQEQEEIKRLVMDGFRAMAKRGSRE
jgi:hypothetical protein